jgi:hypothetical protein
MTSTRPYPGMYVTVTRVHEILVMCSRPLTHLVDHVAALSQIVGH